MDSCGNTSRVVGVGALEQLYDERVYSHPAGRGGRHDPRQPHFRSQAISVIGGND